MEPGVGLDSALANVAPPRDHPLVVYVFSQDKAFQDKGALPRCPTP